MFASLLLRKKLILTTVCFFSIGIAVVSCWAVSIIFFFDKFYYQKSPLYGYVVPNSYPLSNKKNPRSIEKRIADLRQLFPQTVVTQKSHSQKTNQEFPKPFTIAVIGDSMVYGSGVRTQQRFSEVLEKRLNEIRPTRVITLAQVGDSVVDNYYKLQKLEEQEKLDLIIFGIVENDLLIDSPDKYPGERQLYDQLQVLCPGPEISYLETGSFSTFEESLDKLYVPSFADGTANQCFLKEILQRVQNKPLFFFAFMSLTDTYKPPVGSTLDKSWQVIQKYVRLIEEAGIPVVSPENLLYFEYKTASKQEKHPSASTHSQFAESLVKEITSNPQWKFYEPAQQP
jgi:hypothetical protein